MRQVPDFSPEKGPQYCIFGSGRVARHFAHYFSLLGISYWQWDEPRSMRSEFFQRLNETSHLLLLVSDSAIAPIVSDLPDVAGQVRVHFSGATSVPGVISAHPLQTFGADLYTLETYQKIPFVIETESGLSFQEILPGLPNPHFLIAAEKRALYHALCSMAGNFPMILWSHIFSRFEDQVGLPSGVLSPYLEQVLVNSIGGAGAKANLTGPLARGDSETIDRHLETLEGDPLQKLYLAFQGVKNGHSS